MAPTPTPETPPTLDAALVSKTVVASASNLYLGPNLTVKGDSIQTTLPFVTSDTFYTNSLSILPGSTASYILKADNLTIDIAGNLTKVGAITSTGNSSFSGSVSVGSLSTTGSLSANSVTATNGFTTNSGKVLTKELQVTGTKFNVDSLAGTLSLTGTLTSTGVSITNADSTFQIDSSAGTIKTQGTIQSAGAISTTGTSDISAAGALNGASLNIAGTAFKVDNLGAITGTHYSMNKDGNFSHDGNLINKGSASLANGGFLVDSNGNVSKAGTIASGAISVTGSLATTEGITVGANAVKISNNGTSYFVNSVYLGAAPVSGSIYPIMFNATDGSAAFASNKAAIGADGSMTLLNGATLLNADGVKLGVTSTNGTTTNKIELNSSSGNATFAGQASFLGGAATLTSSGLTMLTGDVSVKNISGTGLLNVGGAATLSSGLSVTGASTFNGLTTFKDKVTVQNEQENTGNLVINGNVNAKSALNVTSAATLSSTLAVSGDLSVNTDKFKVTASNGNLTSKGSLTMDGTAQFANNQIQLKSDGSVYAQNYLKTDFAIANYVKSIAADNVTTTSVPAVGSADETALFNSTTNKYLTTQEYVDKAIFKQATRLNLITKDMDVQLATFSNISKVLAAMEGPDGLNPLTTINGLLDNVEDVKLSISDLMGGGYNSIVVNAFPSVWGDGAAPQLIPVPISKLYKEDGWFYSNMSLSSKINWYLPAYSGMKMKDITNLFMNNFLLSTMKLPKITVFTSPKNNSTDAISGVYNAKIEYYFIDANPSSTTAKRSCLYLINSPKNVYSDKSNDFSCKYSLTSNGTGGPVQKTLSTSTTFSTSFDTTKVSSEDSILTFAIETSESTIKDYMFVLQSFNISTKNGTTQMMFQNSSIATDYLFKYFFKQHIDLSETSLDSSNVVDKDNYNAYVSGILGIYPSSSVTNVSPQSHVTGFKTLSLGGTAVTYNNQTINYPVGRPSALLVCELENKNDKLTITKNGVAITPANTVGSYSPTTAVTLQTGNNTFVITVVDVTGDHTTTTTFVASVISNDTKLSSVTMDGQSITLVSGVIPVDTIKNVPAGTTSVTVVGTPNSSSASVLITGATGLVTGNNTVTVKVTAEDGTIATNTFVVHVRSDDTSLSTFTVNSTAVANGSTFNLSAGTTAVSVVAVPTAQSSGATAVISGASDLVLGNNTLTVVVTAESGATRTYTVTLNTLDNNNNLSSLVINGISENMNDTIFSFASTTTSINVAATPVSNKATVAVTGIPTTVSPGTTYNLKITVTAQNSISKEYNYDVRIKSNDNNIDSVSINSQTLQFSQDNIANITLVDTVSPNGLSLRVTEASAATLQYKIENDGPLQSITSGVSKTVSIQQNGTTQIFVIINPEDNSVASKTYTINVKSRSNNTGLSAITVTPQGDSPSSVTNGQTITLASGVNSVVVAATAGYSGATVNIDGVIGTTSSSNTINVSSGTSKTVPIIVTATDGVTQSSYSVTFTAPPATPPTINLTFTNVNGSNYSYTYSIDPTNFVMPQGTDNDGGAQNLQYAPNVPSDVTQLQFTFTNNTTYDIVNGYSLWECVPNDQAYNNTVINLGNNINAPLYFSTMVFSGVQEIIPDFWLGFRRAPVAAGTAPAITTFKIDNVSNPSNTISSSNGVDYYYTSTNTNTVCLSIITSNTTDVSISDPYEWNSVNRISVNTQGTNVVYNYSLYGTVGRVSLDYTITLTNNGVNKTYYLHLTGFNLHNY